MSKFRFALKALLVSVCVFVCTSQALAQQRTFVSVTGVDNATCGRANPCRNFQAAHDAIVAQNGEIIALNSGGFGLLNINREVVVSGEGVNATTTAQGSASAITINTPGGTVILRSLNIMGQGPAPTGGRGGLHGVNVQNARAVIVENCVIDGLGQNGINVAPTVLPIDNTVQLSVHDTVIRNCGIHGILLGGAGAPSGTIIKAAVDRSRFENNDVGISGVESGVTPTPTDTVQGTLMHSDFSGNRSTAIQVVNGAELNVDRCTIFNTASNTAISSGNGAESIIRVAHSAILNSNGAAITFSSGGQVLSRQPQSNTVRGTFTGGTDAFSGQYLAK